MENLEDLHLRLLGVEPKDGAPKARPDSVFVSIPYLGEVVSAADSLKNEKKAETQRRILEDLASKMVTSPRACKAILDDIFYLSHPETANAAYAENAENLRKRLLSEFTKLVEWRDKDEFPPKPEVLEEWLFLYATDPREEYRELAEVILKKMVDRCATRARVVSFIYNLVYAGAISNSRAVTEKILEIVSYKTPIFGVDPENDITYKSDNGEIFSVKETPVIRYLLALFEPEDDEVLQQHMEAESTIEYLCSQYRPELSHERNSGICDEILMSEAFWKKLFSLYGVDVKSVLEEIEKSDRPELKRFYEIRNWYRRQNNLGTPTEVAGVVRVDDVEIAAREFPASLFFRNPGPLREWHNEQIAATLSRKAGFPYVNLSLPGVGSTREFTNYTQVSQLISQEFQKPVSEDMDPCITEARFFRTLSYIAPTDFFGEKQEEMFARLKILNEEMRTNLDRDVEYFLSPRGDQIRITDPILVELGFHETSFEMDPRENGDIIASLQFGNYEFQFLIDSNYRFLQYPNGTRLVLSPFGAFLDYVVLSHLHEILRNATRLTPRRGSKTKADEDILVREKGEEGRRHEIIARRPHFRTLPEGQKPSDEQIRAAAQRPYRVNLVAHNLRRERMDPPLPPQTWVRPVIKKDTPNAPIKCEAPLATEKLRELFEAPY